MSDSHEQVAIQRQEDLTTRPKDIDIEHFYEIRTLGEGSFGQVILVEDDRSKSLYAVKCLNMNENRTMLSEFKKEAAILKKIQQEGGNENIIQYFFCRTSPYEFQIFLEYSEGGELYDLIEPEGGIPAFRAQFFFRQLLSGMQFIHSLGIAHRDIKPENLLLTKNDVLKICDFGLATLFRDPNGTERWLSTPCGSPPYAAPEVLTGRYRGQGADIWSCGVVLAVLMTGELPWARPDKSCAHFAAWVEHTDMERVAWKKLDSHVYGMLRMILVDDLMKRPGIERIMKHPWMTIDYSLLSHAPASKRRKILAIQNDVTVASQPTLERTTEFSANPHLFSFTQPQDNDIVLMSQSQYFTQTQDNGKKDILYRMARRMTRFCVSVDPDVIIKRLYAACEASNFIAKEKSPNHISVTSNYDMDFIINVLPLSEDGKHVTLVDFRRSRGHGLDFKRAFLLLKTKLDDVICKRGEAWLAEKGLIQPKAN